MRKILITGGAGFVGRHFAKRFLDAGDQVCVVDCLAAKTGGIAPAEWPLFQPLDYGNFSFYLEDCRDFFQRVRDTDYDYVLHLAAIVGGRAVIESSPLAVADDLSIDAAYWRWAERCRPGKTVYFSSSAAYPISLQTAENHVLLREDMIDFSLQLGIPDMAYGWAKLTCEYLALLAYEKHGLRSVCYRPFSGYGEDQDAAYPFPSICRRVLDNRGAPTVAVWGSGQQMRDFIHIDDCVDGVLLTMDKVDDGQAINLSTGVLTSFIDFATMAAELVGYCPEVWGMSDMPEGVFARGGDTARQRTLGFTNKVCFRDGVERGLRHFSDSMQ
jgi:GDP-L-fucose synthase